MIGVDAEWRLPACNGGIERWSGIWLLPHSHTISRWSGNETSGITDGMWLCFRLAVLQLAVAGAVFLLDMVHLPRRVREKTLRRFVSEVFGSTNTLKLVRWVGVCECVCVCLSGYAGMSVGYVMGVYVPRNLRICAISRLRCTFSES